MMQKAVRPFDISQIEIAVLTATIASLFSITQSPSHPQILEGGWTSLGVRNLATVIIVFGRGLIAG